MLGLTENLLERMEEFYQDRLARFIEDGEILVKNYFPPAIHAENMQITMLDENQYYVRILGKQ